MKTTKSSLSETLRERFSGGLKPDYSSASRTKYLSCILAPDGCILFDKDVEILQRLLPQNLSQNIKFIAGESYYRARSLASSLLATRKAPVALVLDAHTDNKSQIVERYDLIDYVLNQVSSGISYKVFMAIPQLEIVFLQDKSLIEKIAQRQFNDLEWQLAQSKPKEFLETVFGNSKEQINARIFGNINDQEIKKLQQHPLIQEIISFLSSLIPFSIAMT